MTRDGDCFELDGEMLAYLRSVPALGDPYLWGYHWGRPGDSSVRVTGVDFENDVLRMQCQEGALSLWAPRGLRFKKDLVQPGSITLEVADAQRVRWEQPTAGPGKQLFIEFWRIEGNIYGKYTTLWPNTGVGLGDQSQPALAVNLWGAPVYTVNAV